MDGLDAAQTEALEEMFAGKNVFLSGTGGTGKSAVIRLFLENCRKNIVCVAPAGLAALNLPDAMTIHSFFKFPIDKIMLGVDDVPADAHLTELLRYTDCIVIDEISMVGNRRRFFLGFKLVIRFRGMAAVSISESAPRDWFSLLG